MAILLSEMGWIKRKLLESPKRIGRKKEDRDKERDDRDFRRLWKRKDPTGFDSHVPPSLKARHPRYPKKPKACESHAKAKKKKPLSLLQSLIDLRISKGNYSHDNSEAFRQPLSSF
jgi:murein L,D-transpeptidase YafK